ncbi:uncharacterized protein VTP21DRAFT_2848 [Calcarisporiella thermophila]|uniref:uncharacterized protein n=1 Tax=Calcarisporiella thermophila TaxID=911321 RepID=UPI0037436134
MLYRLGKNLAAIRYESVFPFHYFIAFSSPTFSLFPFAFSLFFFYIIIKIHGNKVYHLSGSEETSVGQLESEMIGLHLNSLSSSRPSLSPPKYSVSFRNLAVGSDVRVCVPFSHWAMHLASYHGVYIPPYVEAYTCFGCHMIFYDKDQATAHCNQCSYYEYVWRSTLIDADIAWREQNLRCSDSRHTGCSTLTCMQALHVEAANLTGSILPQKSRPILAFGQKKFERNLY